MHLLSWTVIHLIVAGGFAALLTFMAARSSGRMFVLAMAYGFGLVGTLVVTCLFKMIFDQSFAFDLAAYMPILTTSLLAALFGAAAGLWWAREYRRET